MKRYLLLVLIPALFMTVPTLARAGVRAESFSVTPVVGGYTFFGAEHLRTKPAGGIRLGYNFTQNFGTELGFDYVRSDQSDGPNPYDPRIGPGSDVNVFKYGIDFLYHFMPEGPLVPYVELGFAEITRDYKLIHDRNKPSFNYGLGMKYFVTDNVAVRGDVRHIIMHDEDTYHNLEYLVGLDFLFGGRKPAALPAAPTTPPPAAEEQPKEAPLVPPPAAEPTPGHYKYCMTLHVEFDIDQAVIRPEYHNEIAKVGDFMKKYPTTTAVIEGHTDNVGNADYNMDLSQRRAQAVVNYLSDKFGIDASRLSAKGYGLTRPVADNSTDEGRQKNRRIEAIIDCAFDVKQAPPPEKLCMTLDLQFDTGKADIKPENTADIDKLGQYMNQYPTATAVIEGHTDNTGSYDGNMKLSQQRAEAVVNYLVEKCGIDRSRLSAKGYGSTRRIAYNSTPEGRQKNRRINAVVDCVVKK